MDITNGILLVLAAQDGVCGEEIQFAPCFLLSLASFSLGKK